MSIPVISLASLIPQPRPTEFLPPPEVAQRLEASFARVGESMGLTTLGCNVTAVPPGRSAFPFHSHRGNDELFVILAGRGELRLGPAQHPVAAGDLVACPCGGPDTAHQLVNTGSDELRYLAVSSLRSPEICEYPDSGKIGAYAGSGAKRFAHISRSADQADYWEGE